MAEFESLVGKIVGNYKVLREIGRGGMGVVYKAHEMSLQRVVALKILPERLAKDPSFVKRFAQEARSAAQLNHPNIVTIHAVGRHEGNYFIAMEYVRGESLYTVIHDAKRLEVSKALDFACQAAEALAEAHRRGIVHRDVKPPNMIVDEAGRLKILDFGLAKVLHSVSNLTDAGGLLGTPRYMSPEQCQGQELDARSDVYSLGITLYEMLAGETPFNAETPLALMKLIVDQPLPSLNEVNINVSKDVANVVHKMTAKRKEDRYQNAEELAEALDMLLQGKADPSAALHSPSSALDAYPGYDDIDETLITPVPFSGARQTTKTQPPWKLIAGAACVALVLIVFLAVYLPFRGHRLIGADNASAWRQLSDDTAQLKAPKGPKLNFVWIPPGTFQRSQQNFRGRQGQSTPAIKGFWMAQHETTVAEFEAFARNTDYKTALEKSGGASWKNPGRKTLPDEPVVMVTKDDAIAYCNWLSQQTGQLYRLPTGDEWQYANQEGSGRSSRFRSQAGALNEFGLYGGTTQDSGSFVIQDAKSGGPNERGLYGMAGNVWEWSLDSVDLATARPKANASRQGGNRNLSGRERGDGSRRGGGRTAQSRIEERTGSSANGETFLERMREALSKLRSATGFRICREQ